MNINQSTLWVRLSVLAHFFLGCDFSGLSHPAISLSVSGMPLIKSIVPLTAIYFSGEGYTETWHCQAAPRFKLVMFPIQTWPTVQQSNVKVISFRESGLSSTRHVSCTRFLAQYEWDSAFLLFSLPFPPEHRYRNGTRYADITHSWILTTSYPQETLASSIPCFPTFQQLAGKKNNAIWWKEFSKERRWEAKRLSTTTQDGDSKQESRGEAKQSASRCDEGRIHADSVF